MAVLLFLTTLLLISNGVTAFNVMGYANVQYSILYYEYLAKSFENYPVIGHPLESEWMTAAKLRSFTDGFFSGIFFNIMAINATENLLKMATNSMLPLAPVANETDTHDVGFVIMSSFGHAYRLFKNPDYLQIVITAANSLSTRYSPTVRCTRSWDSKEGF